MFENMAKKPAAWLSGKGEESLVVLSTRVRLARNVAGCKYPTSADSDTRQRIISYFDSVVTRTHMLGEGQYFKATDINELDRNFLIERHLVSPVFLNGDMYKAVPNVAPEAVWVSPPTILTIPKSIRMACPFKSSMTLAGLMSRCTKSCLWA